MNADGTPNAWKPMEHVWGKFYVDGNIIEGNEEVTQDNWTKGIYGQINNASCDNTFTKKVKKEGRISRTEKGNASVRTSGCRHYHYS